jgi:hypothetical protein
MPIFYVENFFSGFGAPLTYVLPADGVTDSTYCWATVCETTAAEEPMFGDARLGVLHCGPYSDGNIGVRVVVDTLPWDVARNYRVRAFYDTFGEDSPTFSVLGPISTGRGQQTVRVSDDLIYQTDLLWASISEYDSTGQTPIMGDAYLSIQQVVPGPNLSGYVDVGVNIDSASEDLTYRVTVFGVWKDY